MNESIYIPVISSDQEKIMDFIKKVKNSDIEKEDKDDLIRVLQSVIDQMKQFKAYGWL
jgi:uncharacterized protein YpbB